MVDGQVVGERLSIEESTVESLSGGVEAARIALDIDADVKRLVCHVPDVRAITRPNVFTSW